ncbi:MAG: DNA methyltransferase [Nitrososphaeria archaeon]
MRKKNILLKYKRVVRGAGEIYSLDDFGENGLINNYFSREETLEFNGYKLKIFTGEFWTAKQRQGASIHEISYRACFKPQLPQYFIKRLTNANSIIFDPFMGRGTTIVESALNGRVSKGMDVNPLSEILTYPRINIPKTQDILDRLDLLELNDNSRADIDLSMFYHPRTEMELVSLRNYLIYKKEGESEDRVDKWIRMVATNRLTGHSAGFFSVYTMPPNQATTQEEQKRINEKKKQIPEYRDIKKIIKKKTLSLLRDFHDQSVIDRINKIGEQSELLTADSQFASRYIEDESIDLTVTSPPFLNIVQYSKDNWLRCWFNNIDISDIEKKIFITGNLDKWRQFIKNTLRQLFIITKKGGYVAFEVGEVKNGSINLDEYVALDGIGSGFDVIGIFINKQHFTKTSNIWGVENLKKGTNTNRIVLFRKGD